MNALKSSLLILACAAILGCPTKEPVEPEPNPPPEPPEEELGPCEATGARRGAAASVQLRVTESLESAAARLLAPDADGRVKVLVHFAEGQDQTRQLRDRGYQVLRSVKLINGAVLRVTPTELEALRNEPSILHVQEDRVLRSATLHTTPVPSSAFLAQAGPLEPVNEFTWGLRAVQAPDVWDPLESGTVDPDAPAGQGIKVCVLDSGVDRGHQEVLGYYTSGYDFVDGDDNPDDSTPVRVTQPDDEVSTGGGHGTHVSATIGARFGNGASVFEWMDEGGVVGVAPRAEILTGRVLGTEGTGSMIGIVNGIDWCVSQGAHVINMSLGTPDPDASMGRAVLEASQQGVLVLAAAGNDGSSTKHYPAAYPGVMAVAALTEELTRADFSQTGRHISVSAPGDYVLSATIRGLGYYTRLYGEDAEDPAHNAVSGSGFGEYEGAVVDCGLADSYESCGEQATCGGFVALVRRGGLTFGEKVKYARGQGAKLVLIYDPAAEAEALDFFTLGELTTNIPVLSVTRSYGEALLANLGATVKAGIYPTDYELASGTSMATPHVAGVAAVVWSAQPDLTAEQVRQLLECSAIFLGPGEPPASGKNGLTGHGLVQTKGALELLAEWNANGWPVRDSANPDRCE